VKIGKHIFYTDDAWQSIIFMLRLCIKTWRLYANPWWNIWI
jgi:hypothetical protein